MKKACILFCILLISTIGYSFDGSVTRNILDSENELLFEGIHIIIMGTNLGAVSAVDGTFTIVNIPEGKQTIKVSYSGYQSVTRTIGAVSAQRSARDSLGGLS